MPRLFLPRGVGGGHTEDSITLEGNTLRQIWRDLEQRDPELAQRLLANGRPLPIYSVIVDGAVMGANLFAPIPDHCEIHLLPALSGG